MQMLSGDDDRWCGAEKHSQEQAAHREVIRKRVKEVVDAAQSCQIRSAIEASSSVEVKQIFRDLILTVLDMVLVEVSEVRTLRAKFGHAILQRRGFDIVATLEFDWIADAGKLLHDTVG
jgi:hypothetical protein